MKRILGISILLCLVLTALLFSLCAANPEIAPNIPPIVNVDNMQTNAKISSINGQLWAKVDIDYKTYTIHGFGDSYLAQKKYSYTGDNSSYIKVQVVSNRLEAHYPYPLNAENLTVNVNNQTLQWQIDNKGFCHIFDSNLQEINWTIEPVPEDFVVHVHYEQPLQNTSVGSQYLGEYALVFPLIPRYGSTYPPYPLYSWLSYGTTTASFTIGVDNYANEVKVYSIDGGGGGLTEMSYSGNINSTIAMQIPNANVRSIPYGVVIIANSLTESILPTSVPEFSWLVNVSLLLSLFSVAAILKHRKTIKLKQQEET